MLVPPLHPVWPVLLTVLYASMPIPVLHAIKAMCLMGVHVLHRIAPVSLHFVLSVRMEYVSSVPLVNILMLMGYALRVLVYYVLQLLVLIILTVRLICMVVHNTPKSKRISSRIPNCQYACHCTPAKTTNIYTRRI